jgi:hypothetical protein
VLGKPEVPTAGVRIYLDIEGNHAASFAGQEARRRSACRADQRSHHHLPTLLLSNPINQTLSRTSVAASVVTGVNEMHPASRALLGGFAGKHWRWVLQDQADPVQLRGLPCAPQGHRIPKRCVCWRPHITSCDNPARCVSDRARRAGTYREMG